MTMSDAPTKNEETFQTYSLQIIGPLVFQVELWKRLEANLPAMIEAVEEDLTDLLPDEYRARIVAWDEEEDPHE